MQKFKQKQTIRILEIGSSEKGMYVEVALNKKQKHFDAKYLSGVFVGGGLTVQVTSIKEIKKGKIKITKIKTRMGTLILMV